MSAVYDNWERLVGATLLRERLRFLARIDSLSSASSLSESDESFRELNDVSFPDLGHSFTYEQLLHATDGFSSTNLIKRGHSGDFFRGYFPQLSSILDDGYQILRPGSINIVIKRIDLKLVANREAYSSELNFLSKAREASRFFPFLGHCLEDEKEKFLVYKYASKGDLSSCLHKKIVEDGDLQSLDWITRLKIAMGAAERLTYLHDECTAPFVHGDVQASSILVDEKFEVWLGSLSEVSVEKRNLGVLMQMPQSLLPGSSGNPHGTRAYDVYCFGKVLLELVTGRIGISSWTGATAKGWLDRTLRNISIYDKELVIDIIDPLLIIDEDLLEEVWAVAIVARACLNPIPTQRPLMRYVLKALENPLKVTSEEYSGSAATMQAPLNNAVEAFGTWQHNDGATAVPAAAPASILRATGSQGTGRHAGDGNRRRRSFPYLWRKRT